jgi:ERCC4-type nuclease
MLKIIVDSREKWTQPGSTDRHISDWFLKHGIEYEVRKLEVGDYMIEGKPEIVVDRKKSLDELATNLMNRSDSARFWREVRRAHEQHVKLVILCECGGQIKSINDVPKWRSQYSPVTGRRLINEMIRLEMSYGVLWQFCDKRSTARRIVELLSVTDGNAGTGKTASVRSHGGGTVKAVKGFEKGKTNKWVKLKCGRKFRCGRR